MATGKTIRSQSGADSRIEHLPERVYPVKLEKPGHSGRALEVSDIKTAAEGYSKLWQAMTRPPEGSRIMVRGQDGEYREMTFQTETHGKEPVRRGGPSLKVIK